MKTVLTMLLLTVALVACGKEPVKAERRATDAEAAESWATQGKPSEFTTGVIPLRVVTATEIEVRSLGRDEIVTLFGVEVPQHLQMEAVKLLEHLMSDGRLEVAVRGKDAGGRPVVTAYVVMQIDDTAVAYHLNAALAAGGYAKVTTDDRWLRFYESQAKEEGRGVWR
jgi:hypothetical protein